jgi:CubicO group peptidase (beta-lactamase class C family)
VKLRLRQHSDYVNVHGSRELRYEPGTRYEYSNYGYILLGALIEAVSGASYYDHVRDNVFDPAGMTSTDSLPESENVPNRAVGYMRSGDAWVPNTDTLPWRGTTAGGELNGRRPHAVRTGARFGNADLQSSARRSHQPATRRVRVRLHRRTGTGPQLRSRRRSTGHER